MRGFDLHGRIAFGAAQRERLEELVRYCARPPLANDRLEKRADGRYVLRLKSRWRDGTTHLQFEPIELMERLAAQIPKPRINLVLYAGVLAPHSKWRAQAVCFARPTAPDQRACETQTRAERETWSELMRLTFGLDVLACPRCGGRLKHLATILDERVARRILEHVGRRRAGAARAPSAPPAAVLVERSGRVGLTKAAGARRGCVGAPLHPRTPAPAVAVDDCSCTARGWCL